MSFEKGILKVIHENAKNSYESQLTYLKLGRKKAIPKDLKNKIKLAVRNYLYTLYGINSVVINLATRIRGHKLFNFKYLFELLTDDISKEKPSFSF